jgi:hypothetical protein
MAMNVASCLVRLETDLTAPNRDLTAASQALVRTWLEKDLQGDLRALSKQADAILRNPKLSDQGMQDQWRVLGLEFLNRFAWVKQELRDREGAISRNRATLFEVAASPVEASTTTDGLRELLRYLKAKEIRDDFRDADPGERTKMFLRAAERNDEAMLSAVLSAPGEPLIAPVRTDALHARALGVNLDTVTPPVSPSEKVVIDALDARAQRLFGGAGNLYETYQQNLLIAEYLESWRDMLGATFRDLGVAPQTIGEVLGGVLHSTTLGLPDGSTRLEGNAWAQAVATVGV